MVTVLTVSVLLILILLLLVFQEQKQRQTAVSHTVFEKKDSVLKKPSIEEDFLSPNEFSRPGVSLEKVQGVVIHYTANPGTTARQNRDYFEGLSQTGTTYASSHFIIGLGGEIIQCIPLSEIAYASNDRNHDTISIECCIPDETGRFTESTYQTLVELTVWLVKKYDLEVEDVIRHYDVTGKNCPKYFVENGVAWRQFKEDVSRKLGSQ